MPARKARTVTEVRELMRRNGGVPTSVLASAVPPRAASNGAALVKQLQAVGIVFGSRPLPDAGAALDAVRRAAEVAAQTPVFVSKLSSDS
jgi:hypothetical protein